MAQGVPTDESVIAEFRARYLYSGNASKSAREVELPESTGRDLAQRLSEEPDFVEARRKLRVRALDDLVTLRQRMAETAADRFHDETGGIDVKEFGGEDASITIVDKRHEYGKLVIDAEKNAHNLARFDAERAGEIGPDHDIKIIVSGPAEKCQSTS